MIANIYYPTPNAEHRLHGCKSRQVDVINNRDEAPRIAEWSYADSDDADGRIEYRRVTKLEVDGNVTLEKIFELMNRIEDGMDCRVPEGERSMCVGDIVEFEVPGGFVDTYIVAPVGFLKVICGYIKLENGLKVYRNVRLDRPRSR